MLDTVAGSIVAAQQRPRRRVATAMLKIIGTALLTAVLTSFFWIWFYGSVPGPAPQVARSGPVVTVKPENAPPVVIAEQVQVAPSGLALPVVSAKPDQLTDTFTQAGATARRR